jgi:hypothetical protein
MRVDNEKRIIIKLKRHCKTPLIRQATISSWNFANLNVYEIKQINIREIPDINDFLAYIDSCNPPLITFFINTQTFIRD